jgi:UDP-N-acetylmuramate dehydrogenase
VQWNYRHTSFKEGELILGATLRLKIDDPDRIKARMDDAKNRRLATQPHGSRSAGCFFKNPPTSSVGTGKMIDDLGMKGTRRGTAVVSPVHANFIVTEGDDARAEDALALAEEIRERIKREHGVELEYEVELWRANKPLKEREDDEAKEEGDAK